MITKISGKLDEVLENGITILNSGMFFEILMTPYSIQVLKNKHNIGDDILIYTKFYIEAGIAGGNFIPRLLGFVDKSDSDFFKVYTTVKGLGDKKGLKSMALPTSDIANAIESSDQKTLKSLPGIGARMADKIVAELKGKLALYAHTKGDLFVEKVEKTGFEDEALEILIGQLGYRRIEAENMVEASLSQGVKYNSVEELIQAVFNRKNSGNR